MAKKSNTNILEQERRKRKAKEIKKHKEQRNKDKLEKLKQLDPKRLEKRLNDLIEKKRNNNGRLIFNEQKLLDNLTKDLELLKKNNLIKKDQQVNLEETKTEHKIDDTDALGKKSIFYDPEWNPLGLAPQGYQNLEYPLESPIDYPINESIRNIPLPSSPPPKYFKIDSTQTTYESKDTPKYQVNFIPSTVRNQQK